MASNGRNGRSTNSNSEGRSNTTDPLNDSGPQLGQTASELSRTLETEKIRIRQLIEARPKLNAFCRKHEIQHKIAKHLLELDNFEISVVCDDSGSMTTLNESTKQTRWEELCKIVKIIVEIGVIFDTNGVDIHFLNRRPVLNVKDPAIIDKEFRINPDGYTPLSSTLEKIFRSDLADPNHDKKLLVFIATDGEPTDEDGCPNVPELKRVMEKVRTAATTHVSFLVCSEDDDAVVYLSNWDKEMTNVDMTDDYKTERDTIRRYRGRPDYPFSHGDYIVKAMMGSVVPELDRLNEPD